MKPRLCSLVRVCAVLALVLTLALSGRPPAASARTGAAGFSEPGPSPSASLAFVENAGQFAAGARFQVRGPGVTVWLADDAIWLSLFDGGSGANVRLSFPGANPHPRLEPFDRLLTRVSYFSGSTPAQWRAGVPAWGGVRYVDLYPGIDLELGGEQGRVVPRLLARPGADLGAVRLRVEGALAAAVDGDMLRLTTATGEGTHDWPLLHVEGPSTPAVVRPVGFQAFEVVSPFAPAAAVGADMPAMQLAYAIQGRVTGAGGAGVADVTVQATGGHSATTDASGAYTISDLPAGSYTLTPTLASYGFAPPTRSAVLPPDAADQDFRLLSHRVHLPLVIKAPGPSDLLYGTFLGGNGDVWGDAIAVDASGGVYVVGSTCADDFPTTPGAFDEFFNGGGCDAFVVKLSAAGTGLEYATYLGGTDLDFGHDIAVDGSGAVYVTGETSSDDFPTTPDAYDPSYYANDAFAVKLNAAGSALVYATYLGGRSVDVGYSIAVDGSGAAYITGQTQSSDLFEGTPDGLDPTFDGDYDGFVLKLKPDGSDLEYGTFLGGSGSDSALGIAVDGSGAAYVTGWTESADFFTHNALDDTCGTDGDCNNDSDAFVVKLNATGSALVYGTFLGGSKGEWGSGIAVDGNGAAYVTGWTAADFPTTPGAFDTSFNGSYDAYVVKLNASGSALDYGTFLGDVDYEAGFGVAVDGSGAAYVAGTTGSDDFPTTPGAFDTRLDGYMDGFVVRLNASGSALDYGTFLGGAEFDESYAIAVDGSGIVYVTGATQSPDFPTTPGPFDTIFEGYLNAFAAWLQTGDAGRALGGD